VSNFLALATVTAVLKRMLGEALAAGAPGTVANAGVTSVRPEAAANGNGDRRGINVYLFQATPNGALRNADLPTRRDDGRVVTRPLAAGDPAPELSLPTIDGEPYDLRARSGDLALVVFLRHGG
jgi:hypothetical protein